MPTLLSFLKDTCIINLYSLDNGDPVCFNPITLISIIIVMSFIIGTLWIINHYSEVPADELQHLDSFDTGEAR